ncbi:MAG TPA: CoA-binding protein [Candidatus Pacearchaeota archaeon]|nr:CoA-binding protein [Candidatus Pacearchaeota archaeon]HPR80289.1 CoA-binding protein [Candidatus Pacearchaeota archaeon]
MKKIFNPKSIALIGASDELKTVGLGLAKNLLEGKDLRKIYFVNPKRKEVLGIKCFDTILDIKDKIDLVIIAVPSKLVKNIVSECCEKKVGTIIIVSSGFKEAGNVKEEEEIRDIARKYKIPLIGPNCLGIINPSINLNASFAPITPKKGNIAFLSQSGALLDSVVDKNKLGFSKVISYGNEAGIDLADFIEYLKTDNETKVISIYFEGVKDGRKFMRIAKEVSKIKPIVAIKSGRSDKGKEAVGTHTGTLAGDYSVYQAAMKQSGVILVDTLEELFDVSLVLSSLPKCENGIGIVTNGGGLGVLTVDYCSEMGIEIPSLSKTTISFLEKNKVMEKVVSKNNPLDVLGDALSDRYAVAIESLLKQNDINGLIVISTPQLMTEHEKNAKIITELRNKYPLKPIVCCFLGGQSVNSAIEYLESNRIPNYTDVKRAVKSINSLIKK